MAPPLCLPLHSRGGGGDDDDGRGGAGSAGEGEGQKMANEEEEKDGEKKKEEEEQGRLKAERAAGSHDVIKGVFDAFDANGDGVITVQELCEWMQRLGLAITEDGIRDMVVETSGHDKLIGFDEFCAFAQTLESEKAHHRLQPKSPSNNFADEACPEDKDDSNCYDHNGDDSKTNQYSNNDGTGDTRNKNDLVASVVDTGDGDGDGDDDEGEIREAFQVFDKNGDGLISPSDLRSTLSGLGLLSSSTSFRRIRSMIRRVDTDLDGFVSLPEFTSMIKDNK